MLISFDVCCSCTIPIDDVTKKVNETSFFNDIQNISDYIYIYIYIYIYSGFGGLRVAFWFLISKFAGSNPAEAVGFLRAKKIFSTPSFGGEVKPSVPCRRFAACKRSLNLRGSRSLGKITGQFLAHSSPFTAKVSRVVADVQAPGGECGNV